MQGSEQVQSCSSSRAVVTSLALYPRLPRAREWVVKAERVYVHEINA